MKSNIFPSLVSTIESISFNYWNSRSWSPGSCVYWFILGQRARIIWIYHEIMFSYNSINDARFDRMKFFQKPTNVPG